MVLGYDMGFIPCLGAGLACFVIGILLGNLCQILMIRRRLRRYVRKQTSDGS